MSDFEKESKRENGALNNRKCEAVAGVLLAAGASTRMGKPKQLLSAPGGTLLGRVLKEALTSHLTVVILVLGHEADRIRRALRKDLNHPKLKVVENREYRKGISSSIKTGLSATEDRYDHVMILLADMPHINAELINQFLCQYLISDFPAGAISINGKRSHPVIFSRRFFPELYRLKGDVGAKALFQKYSESVCFVEPVTPYDDRDIDTVEDYLRFEQSTRD